MNNTTAIGQILGGGFNATRTNSSTLGALPQIQSAANPKTLSHSERRFQERHPKNVEITTSMPPSQRMVSTRVMAIAQAKINQQEEAARQRLEAMARAQVKTQAPATPTLTKTPAKPTTTSVVPCAHKRLDLTPPTTATYIKTLSSPGNSTICASSQLASDQGSFSLCAIDGLPSILRTTPTGESTLAISFSADSNFTPSACAELPTGGGVCLGITPTGIRLVKLTSEGNPEWDRGYDIASVTPSTTTLTILPNGHLMAKIGNASQTVDMELSSSGALISAQRSGETGFAYAPAASLQKSGIVLTAGSRMNASHNHQGIVTAGTSQAVLSCPNANIKLTALTDTCAVGTKTLTATGQQICVVSSLDTSGTPTTVRTFGETGFNYQPTCAYKMTNNNHLIAGTRVNSSNGQRQGFITEITPEGTTVWTKAYNPPNAQFTLTGVSVRGNNTISALGTDLTNSTMTALQLDPTGAPCAAAGWQVEQLTLPLAADADTHITTGQTPLSAATASAVASTTATQDAGVVAKTTCAADAPPPPKPTPTPIPTPKPTPKQSPTPIIPVNFPWVPVLAGVSGGVFGLGLIAGIGICVYKCKHPKRPLTITETNLIEQLKKLGVRVIEDNQLKINLDHDGQPIFLGRGSFGDVFEGQFASAPAAIKRINVQNKKPQEIQAIFQEVANMLKLSATPGLVSMYGIHLSAGGNNIEIIMELMKGGSLTSLLNSGENLTEIVQLQLAHDIVAGVERMHTKIPPMIHRDLKSANLLLTDHLTKGGALKISDFGTGKEIQAAQATMTACGTPAWSAPEVLRGDPNYTLPADVYSVGVILWEIFTRQIPYPGMNPMQVILSVTGQNLRPPMLPKLAESPVGQLIRACWHPDPNQRPNITQVRERLTAIMHERRPAHDPISGGLRSAIALPTPQIVPPAPPSAPQAHHHKKGRKGRSTSSQQIELQAISSGIPTIAIQMPAMTPNPLLSSRMAPPTLETPN